MKYKNVVWDWNGTLLNDVKVGVNTLNDMLGRRGLPLLSVEDYKEKFGFPELSVDFVETYDKYAGEVGLNEGVREVLAGIQQTGVKQYVLSALREDLLQQMLRHFQIDSRFDRACGANDIYAAGKIERGQQMLQTCPIVPEDTLMVGDTIHDAEVADALGFDCILFAGGHNNEERLQKKAPVIHRMRELLTCV